jgi:hypothetical protein
MFSQEFAGNGRTSNRDNMDIPRRIHAISVFNSSIILCIHLVVGLFANISGRLPTIGHGLGPGGSLGLLGFWYVMVLIIIEPKHMTRKRGQKDWGSNQRKQVV